MTLMSNLDLRCRKPVLWLTMTALFMGMNVVMSAMGLSIPVPGGHLYLNDMVIGTAALMMDPLSAFCVGGVGAFLGDLLSGYTEAMLTSLVSHGLQAVAIAVLARKLPGKKPLRYGLALAVGAVIMVIGYTLGRAFIYRTPEYAWLKLPFEILQAGVGAVVAWLLCVPLGLEQRFHKAIKSS